MSECCGCSVNLWQFVDICSDLKTLCEFLAVHGVLKKTHPCCKCGNISPLNCSYLEFICNGEEFEDSGEEEGSSCTGRKSARAGTWFMKNNLGIQKACQLVFLWLTLPYPKHAFIMNELHVNFATVAYWSKLCRHICQEWLSRKSVRLGGDEHTVELNQSNINAQKGKSELSEKWLIGGYERETGNCFIEYIPKRNPETVKSVIRAWVLPGTTLLVSKGQLPFCADLLNEGYLLRSVNGVRSFIDPVTGDHTQTVRRLWRDLRTNIPSGSRCNFRENLPGYIAEFMFKRRYPNHTQRAHAFFSEVAEIHPPQ